MQIHSTRVSGGVQCERGFYQSTIFFRFSIPLQLYLRGYRALIARIRQIYQPRHCRGKAVQPVSSTVSRAPLAKGMRTRSIYVNFFYYESNECRSPPSLWTRKEKSKRRWFSSRGTLSRRFPTEGRTNYLRRNPAVLGYAPSWLISLLSRPLETSLINKYVSPATLRSCLVVRITRAYVCMCWVVAQVRSAFYNTHLW